MANVIEEKHFICADVSDNHNKTWSIYLQDDSSFYTTNGKVGYKQNVNETKHWSGAGEAKKEYDRLIRSKEKKGYKALQTLKSQAGTISAPVSGDLKEIAKKQIEVNDPIVHNLLEYLVKTNAHNVLTATGGRIKYQENTGLFQTPCGIVTQEAIDRARTVLMNMYPYVQGQQFSVRSYLDLLNEYLMLIPQNLGMKHAPESIYKNVGDLAKQSSIIDMLETSLVSALNQPITSPDGSPAADAPKVFSVKLHLVKENKVIDRITKKFLDTLNTGHSSQHLRPKTIYQVEISGMSESFKNDGQKIGNLHELWHGTRTENLLSILKSGLRLPSETGARTAGAMFGLGIYFALQSTKSLNYSHGVWTSGGRDNNCFMFLAQVSVGKFYVPSGSGGNRPGGYDSIWAKPKISGVINDEIIVPRPSMCDLCYLIEFSPNGK